MYELVETISGWEIHTKYDGAFKGPFVQIMAYCIKVLDFDPVELEVAVSEMCKNNHNCAHFGVFKGLIYTYNKEDKRKVG